MPRIVGIDIPLNKRTEVALTSVYGIGRHNVGAVLKTANVDPDKRASALSGEEISRLTKALETYSVEGELRKTIRDNIERLKRAGTYRGMRHAANLPVRGQRTRTNARTKRGKRMTVGALKKEESTKTEQAATSEEKK